MKSISLILFSFGSALSLANEIPIFKICVPKIIQNDCLKFLNFEEPNEAKIECVTGRDRMQCLEKLIKREADFIFAEPEDMYVASHMNNEDFLVFSELRNNSEPLAEFRYEAVILVRKSSNIHSLADLEDKKACFNGGYNNMAGYNIPITKLKDRGVLRISSDRALPQRENELKAVSDLFSQACIAGDWSPNSILTETMKQRYSNLCGMCKDPETCSNRDTFSSAIHCVDQNNGDVAFTTSFLVKKYFGLPIGNGNLLEPLIQPEGIADNFEYLCEDGSRLPITEHSCSWAQQPWQGYIGNADVAQRLATLHNLINNFYTLGKISIHTNEARNMSIHPDFTVVVKSTAVYPEQYLNGYKTIIERDIGDLIRFCVSSDIELKKCDTMKWAAYSRGVRPGFMCIKQSKEECIGAVNSNAVDIVAVTANNHAAARASNLKPIVYATYDENEVYVAVVLNSWDNATTTVRNSAVHFEPKNIRSMNAALYLLSRINIKKCPNELMPEPSSIEIVHSSRLPKLQGGGQQLLCPDLSRRSFEHYKVCNLEVTLPTAIFARSDLSNYEIQPIVHAFTMLSSTFGPGADNQMIFQLFGEFEKNQKDVLFADESSKFVAASEYTPLIDGTQYNELRCV